MSFPVNSGEIIPFQNRLRRWLLDPVTRVNADPVRSRALAALLLSMALVALVLSVFSEKVYGAPPDTQVPFSLFTLTICVILILIYGLCRYGYYSSAAWLTVTVMSAGVFIIAADNKAEGAFLLIHLLIPTMIAGVFISPIAMVLVGGLNVIVALALARSFTHLLLKESPVSPFVIIGIVVTVVLPLAYLIDKRQRELADHQKNFHRILEASPDTVAIFRDGVMLYVNQAGLALLGADSAAQVIGLPVSKFMRTGEAKKAISHPMRIKASSALTLKTNEEFVRLDGTVFPAEVITMPVQYDGEVATQMIVRNPAEPVTQHPETLRHALIFNTQTMAISITELNSGRFIDVNDYFLEMSGYTRDEVIGKTAYALNMWAQPEDRQEWVQRLLQDKVTRQTNVLLRRKSGDLIRVTTSQQLIDLDGEPCIVSVSQDNTERHTIETELRKSEDRYRVVSEIMSDFAYSLRVEASGLVTLEWITDSFTRMTGYSIEAAGKWEVWKQIILPEDFDLFVQSRKQLTRGQKTVTELRLRTHDGRVRWFRDHAHPVLDEKTGQTVAIYAAAQDITSQYEIESSLKIHALQQAIVAELGQRALARIIDAAALLQEAVTLAAQVLAVDRCIILEICNDSDQTVSYGASIGWDAEDGKRIAAGAMARDSQVTYTLQTKEPVVSESLADETRFNAHDLVEHEGLASGITLLIQGQDRPLGVIGAYAYAYHPFSPDDINFLQSVANILASYSEHERAERAEREQRTLAEALHNTAAILNSTLELDQVLKRMLDNLARVVPHDGASVMLVEDGAAKIVRNQGFGQYNVPDEAVAGIKFSVANSPILTRMIQSGQPVIVGDVRQQPGWNTVSTHTWIRSYLGAPIMFHGELLGFINVDSATTDSFTQDHAQRLLAFADQASIAIRNARRAQELEKRVAERTEELDSQRHKLQAILDSTGEGIVYTEGDEIRYTNQMFCDMTGFTTRELQGRSIVSLMEIVAGKDDALNRWREAQAAMTEGHVWRDECRLMRKDGTAFDAGLTASLALDITGRTNTVIVVRDISQDKELQAQKARFIANASHELRTPITSMNTRMYMIHRDPDNAAEHLGVLERIIHQMNQLIEDLLDVSRFENGVITLRKRNTVLQTLITEVLELQLVEADRKQITVEEDLPQHPLTVYVDPDRMLQVFTNLIVNAINYTPAGGHIRVRMLTEIRSGAEPDRVAVYIIDDGIGIARENLENIFQPFYRVAKKVPGTGLGLSIVREIVLLHGGEITVESDLNAGSSFCVTLPLLPLSLDESEL